uniref:Uncharacterized protein n=1 Tax=viral metagenome TaxID=1070528 RepID=A0A6M3JV59_9ZZZZ
MVDIRDIVRTREGYRPTAADWLGLACNLGLLTLAILAMWCVWQAAT